MVFAARSQRKGLLVKSHSSARNRIVNFRTLMIVGLLGGVSLFALYLGSSSSRPKATRSSRAHSASINSNDVTMPVNKQVLELRLRNALWSYFAGDALAAPTHWFYGGPRQVKQYYNGLISDYTKPSYTLQGSIMNKSNLNGGGRSSGSSSSNEKNIIGDVINHGKASLWDPSKEIHYHATLAAGENTLEVQLARVLMKSIVATDGQFDADHFRQAYITFMTTAGSHNDAYASTCHRMFFKNLVAGKDPKNCPDNDMHNVDTIDGLVLPTIVSLSMVGRVLGNEKSDAAAALEQAAQAAADCVGVTRNSRVVLEGAARAWSRLVIETVTGNQPLGAAVQQTASSLNYRAPVARDDEMTACYLNSAFPSLLNSLFKYSSEKTATCSQVWSALLQNANTGGENVHRGSCLGAVLGGLVNEEVLQNSKLAMGLHDHAILESEIDEFVKVAMQ
ncbi:hypothetical protein MPSEU_001046300 [Mayamaea pseudoterrestris]|nr:hypothetical protein MPSEU_001046300 [Mayamaea pseudoterrestris]